MKNNRQIFRALKDVPHGERSDMSRSHSRDQVAIIFGKFIEKNEKKLSELMMIVNKHWYKRYAIRFEEYADAVGEAYQLGMKHAKER